MRKLPIETKPAKSSSLRAWPSERIFSCSCSFTFLQLLCHFATQRLGLFSLAFHPTSDLILYLLSFFSGVRWIDVKAYQIECRFVSLQNVSGGRSLETSTSFENSDEILWLLQVTSFCVICIKYLTSLCN